MLWGGKDNEPALSIFLAFKHWYQIMVYNHAKAFARRVAKWGIAKGRILWEEIEREQAPPPPAPQQPTLETIDPNTLDHLSLDADKARIRRTRNLRLIPYLPNRTGGKVAAVEWGHVIGIFQTLMFTQLNGKRDAHILDVGCGSGLLAIAGEPFVSDGGRYTGIDVIHKEIAFCRQHYVDPWFQFQHLNLNNAFYTMEQGSTHIPWDIADASQDLVTALSVWTHLNEADATFYFKEINRVLKPGGKAIITFFLLDDTYYDGITNRQDAPGRYHMTPQTKWIFDQPINNSQNWFSPGWVAIPENAVGVQMNGLEQLVDQTQLRIHAIHPGNWKEQPGVFFQDIVTLEKVSYPGE